MSTGEFPPGITWRRLGEADFPLLKEWLERPHVARWWNHETAPEAVARDFGPAARGEEPSQDLLAYLGDRPFALVQRCRFADYAHDFAELAGQVDVPAHAATIDYLIGDEAHTGRGLGPRLIAAVVHDTWGEYPEVAAIVVPVHAGNRPSWRALEKAGFRRVAEASLEPDNPVDDRSHFVYRIDRPAEIDGVQVLAFADGAAFEDWLTANHTRHEGLWIKVAKKKSGIPTVTDDEMVDIGLCFGWISGQRRSLDDRFYLQKYVPRRPRSLWSQVNVEKVAALTAAGRMREPGLAEVRKAQEDGRWAGAYESQKTWSVPADFTAALDADPEAKRVFDALDKSARYLVVLPVLQARTPAARTARIGQALRSLTEGRADGPAGGQSSAPKSP
ncbi:GNAT family N-acetyltransferase [Streptodolium elevatio]|uniref:GNAT family N-acetyltransferase n=1 Tax=Streptodolium elevatio TaxID=3157996 RepID=A0ABV3DNI2_9ACTN